MTWTYNGNVGIGTSNPYAKFHVLTNAAPGIYLTGNSNNFCGSDVFISRTAAGDDVGFGPCVQLHDDVSGLSGMLQSSQGKLIFFTSSPDGWNESLRVSNYGNVGIGAESNISQFQVEDGPAKASIGEAGGQDLHYGTSYLGFNAARNSTNTWISSSDGNNNGGGIIYSNITGSIFFAPIASTGNSTQNLTDAQIAGKIQFRIDADGSVYGKK